MNAFLTKIAGLCLMRMLLDLALPEGDARRYADLGAGLTVTLCMLRSLATLLQGMG